MDKTPTPTRSHWPDYLDKMDGKVAIKAGVTAALSFFLGIAFNTQLNRPDALVSGLWCILTSIVVLQPHLGGTYRAAGLRFLGVLVGSILGAVFTTWFGSSPIPLGISVACTVAICSLLNLSDSFRIAAMSVAVVMVLWGLHPTTSPWVFGLYRFLDSCLGIIIAVVVTHTLWPAQATTTVQNNLAKALQLLSQFYLNGVSLEAPRERLDRLAQDDMLEIYQLIHENLNALDESKLELLMRHKDLECWKELTNTCESLVDKIAGLRSIDKRVLSMIIDDELAKHLDAFVNETDSALKKLSKQLDKNSWNGISIAPIVQQSQKELENDLLRFRSTKTTRKFELQDVEGFFVFFYTVVLIGEQIPRLEENVKKILEA